MNFKTMLLAVAMISAAPLSNADSPLKLAGAGATFPAPLYKQWISAYRNQDQNTAIEYEVVGSGEGVNRFLANKIDFGASDAPLTSEQAKSAKQGAVVVPTTAGMITLVYNLPGLNGPLKLSRTTYTALLMGKIPRWNDARIQATNPGLNLPDREVVLVARLDSSGTTYALTKHLNTVSPDWSKRGPGLGKLAAWPTGTMLLNGNEGVAARVKMAIGAVGYVEYGFAKQLKLSMAELENQAGNFIAPSGESGTASIASNSSKEESDITTALLDPMGSNAYPVVSYSWMLLKKDYGDAAKSTALKRFVAWGLESGQEIAASNGYIRLPAHVSQMGKELLKTIR